MQPMQAQSQFLDIYRSMARATNDSIAASLQSAERLHQKQLDVVRSALEQSTSAAKQLADARSVDELVSTQTRILGGQLAQSVEIWRSMFRAFGDAQITLMAQMQNQVGQATESMRQAYDITKRAADDAARVVASQVTSVNTASRESASERRPEPQRKSA